MTDKQIIFKCDVDCTLKNTEECLELDCIKGQESILRQLQAKEQECEKWKNAYEVKEDALIELKKYCENLEEYCEELEEQHNQLKAEKEELNKQLQSTKGLVTVGNKQLLDAINAYTTVRTTLEDVKIMLQVVTETNNVYPLQTNLLLMLEKIREVSGE